MIDPVILASGIAEYLEKLVPPLPDIFEQVDDLARAEGHPIVSKDAGLFLHLLTKLVRPRRILEIGCSIGYSGLWMGTALQPGAQIDTIEINRTTALKAEYHFQAMGLSDSIYIHLGAALQVLPQLHGPYDMVFIDAVKSEYIQYLELTLPKVRPGGLILVDNVLWSGRVAQDVVPPQDTATRALQAFNEYFVQHPELEATILSVGDGLGFGLKR